MPNLRLICLYVLILNDMLILTGLCFGLVVSGSKMYIYFYYMKMKLSFTTQVDVCINENFPVKSVQEFN